MARQDALLRLHKTLVTRRAEILKKLTDDMQDLGGGVPGSGDAADVAFETAGDEMASHLAEMDSRELEQIERALGRLKQGTYGVCESCAQKIPVGRLNALPYSTLCIDCQREMERFPDWGRAGSHGGSWDRVYDAPSHDDHHREVRLSDIEIDLPK
jgi:DnaK suppressor protein